MFPDLFPKGRNKNWKQREVEWTGTNQYVQLLIQIIHHHCAGKQHLRDISINHTVCKRSVCLCVWTVCCLSEVVGWEHALGPAQDGVLGRVVRMLFGWDFQHGWDRLHVSVDGVTDHLSDELVDQDDANVVTRQEAPAEREVEGEGLG